jgi:hypothetical protein
MLSAIEKDACTVGELKENLAKLAMAEQFAHLRGDMSPDRIWTFFQSEFKSCLEKPVKFVKRLEARNNLWPSLATENNKAIGLDWDLFEEHAALIKGLVSRRNEIAHGKKMVIKGLKEYQTYENAALLVMHELAVCVVNSLENRCFVNPIHANAA